MSYPHLRILYATVSGTARLVADAIALECAASTALEPVVEDMHDAESDVFDAANCPFLLVVATTGSGDAPADAQALLQSLQGQPRFLGKLQYGLIALGDSSYGNTFCGGGLLFDALLTDLGARRLGDPLCLDATEEASPEQSATLWFRTWAKDVGLQGSGD